MFGTSTNIFRWESAYFLHRLQFSFLVGGGCAMFQILIVIPVMPGHRYIFQIVRSPDTLIDVEHVI
jgi:hypothetical protein